MSDSVRRSGIERARRDFATEILARTLYAELPEAPPRAREALAALVMNRARLAARSQTAALRWGRTVPTICRAPFQFRAWQARRPEHIRALRPDTEDPAWLACRRIASRALAGAIADPTGGATHFHARAELPSWAIGRSASAELCELVFYRDVL